MLDPRAPVLPAFPHLATPHAYGGRIQAQGELAIPLAEGCVFIVDGNATVRSVTPHPPGVVVTLYFTGAPTFVHSARLVIPGAANVTFAAGRTVQLFSLGDGKWVILSPPPGAVIASPFGADNRLLRSDGTGFGGQASEVSLDDDENLINLNTIYLNGAGVRSIVSTTSNGVKIEGTNTNDDAPAGYVGQCVEASVQIGSSVALSNSVVANITSISLTAGDWDVEAVGYENPAATTTITRFLISISTASATIDAAAGNFADKYGYVTALGNQANPSLFLRCRIKVAATTTIYLVVIASFGVSTFGAFVLSE